MTEFIIDAPDEPKATFILAHGANGPMDAPIMAKTAVVLKERGFRVARFEFPFMAERRRPNWIRRPSDTPQRMQQTFIQACADIAANFDGPVVIGGKSLGGRVASAIADRLAPNGRVKGVVCFGFPFHPPQMPKRLQSATLQAIKTPTLLCQGTKDPHGTEEEVKALKLSDAVRVHWVADGDHHLAPPADLGKTFDQTIGECADAVSAFLDELAPGARAPAKQKAAAQA